MGWDAEQEQHWLAELRGGDEAAFRLIYQAYRPRLYTFLCRLSGRPDVAEDLLQEVWLRLATRPPEPRAELSLAPWLFRVARNVFVSYLRNRGREPIGTGELGLLEFRPAPGPGPLEALAERETVRSLERALRRLPLADRECVLLVAAGGLAPVEAAGALGLRPDAFRQRLSRARARLAELLRSTA
jgi:RNA polymerase sigma-70 factor (ECF subfamily)